MQFNHYGGEGAQLAADLVNVSAPLTAAELEPVLALHGIVERSLTAAQAGGTWTWSRRLAPCFGPQDLELRCQRINKLLADAFSQPYISLHDGHPHLHYSDAAADADTHIRTVTIAGIAYVVCFAGATRLGRCARHGCNRAFVDISRNGRRTYCSVRCANNDAVARHREQRRSGSQETGTKRARATPRARPIRSGG
ncbi:hypothetical protein FDG2_5697 [Candidatus Protofrankia californiensis]|uniref:Zinc finger CGNR domain-containing protein n=1 Tax=Candidatus Protofrankia californiensis TaxID=1839754 RepID=A0A1C3PF74_9ACTN|nr:hypothetical protein FDG2_5697 [Candidatus Protofrankia californiensis]